ncbi:MAG: hypothetical protein BAJALOKI3v1_150018 [Promethearchaeota archaeon]|jgi:hypothetical protein|nr:MAG: hypothetical protein BAJALOKI3v1_150018 [Candidatus Lokiarchaeota archaeon]
MTTGYCPHCGEVVLGKREDIDICLAIILAIFTAGIGLIIYLIIWYSKDENRCVHCNSVLRPTETQFQPSQGQPYRQEPTPPQQNPYKMASSSTSTSNSKEEVISGGNTKYCPFCGSDIEPGAKFCPNCGSKI